MVLRVRLLIRSVSVADSVPEAVNQQPEAYNDKSIYGERMRNRQVLAEKADLEVSKRGKPEKHEDIQTHHPSPIVVSNGALDERIHGSRLAQQPQAYQEKEEERERKL